MLKKSHKSKSIIRAFVLLFMFTILLSSTQKVQAEGNWHNTSFERYYNGDGSDVRTPTRPKLDYTPSYIYNRDSEQDFMGVWVETYDKRKYIDCTQGRASYVAVGEERYLHNLVKENGYHNANLRMMSASHKPSQIDIDWSPDSKYYNP